MEKPKNGNTKTKVKKSKKVRTSSKLTEGSFAKRNAEFIESKTEHNIDALENKSWEEICQQAKEMILSTAKEVCGTTAIHRNKKQTRRKPHLKRTVK